MKSDLRPLSALLIGLMFVCGACFESGQKYDGKTAVIEKGPLLDVVEASGVLRSTNSVSVSVPKIPSMYEFTISYLAPEGKEAKVGMPLISFDTKELDQQMPVLQGQLASARKTLEKMEIEEREKLENLVIDEESSKVDESKARRAAELPEVLSSRIDVEKLKHDLSLAVAKREMSSLKVQQQRSDMTNKLQTQRNAIRDLEQRLAELQQSIDAMTVMATKAGLVVYHEMWGRKPAIGESAYLGQTLLEIPDLTHMEVLVSVDEPDAGRIAQGQEVEFRLDANPERNFRGKVSELGRIFHAESRMKPTTVFDAQVTTLDPDPEIMRPGMTAKVRIIINRADEALLVPEKALTYQGEQVYVRLVKDGRMRRQQVEIGRRAGGFYEVLKGLSAGDRVAIEDGSEERGS